MRTSGSFPVFNGGITASGYADGWNAENTIIISEGGNSCGFVNRVFGRFWQGGHCYKVDSRFDANFLYQFLKYWEPTIMSLRVGSGLPNIPKDSLYKLEVRVPESSREQLAIAKALGTADMRISTLSSLLAKQEAIKKSTLNLLMEATQGWRQATVGDLFDVSSGLSKPASAFGKGFPFLSFMTIFTHPQLPPALHQLVQSTSREQQTCSIRRGDVFLTRTSETVDELGMSAVALKDYPTATFNGFSKRLRPKTPSTLWPEFASYYFRTHHFRKQIDDIAVVTTRASLSATAMSKLRVNIPSFAEQQRIAAVLATMDKTILATRAEIEKAQQLKTGLMRYFFDMA